MTAILPKFICSPFLFNKITRVSSTHPKLYSTLIPARSPMFVTQKEVTNWFKMQADNTRKAFFTLGTLSIFSHEVCLGDRILPSGESVKKGQVISTTEFKVYDFQTKKWL